MALKLRRNDKIIILTGKDKGKKSTIKNILSSQKVIINGLNLIKNHQKQSPSHKLTAGILDKDAPIHISHIAILIPESNKADRIGFRFEEGKKIRFFKSNKKAIK